MRDRVEIELRPLGRRLTVEPGTPLQDLLHEHGFGAPAPTVPTDDVDRLGRALIDVLATWAGGDEVSPAVLTEVFADNVGPDDAFGRRAVAARGHGALTIDEIRPTSDAAARLVCRNPDGGRFTVTFSLAPMQPARIQQYSVEGAAG